MAVKVELIAENFEELKQKLAEMAVTLGIGGFSDSLPETKKSSPKEKKQKAEKIETANTAPTLELASSKLKSLNDLKGISVAREVLAAVGFNRMSEVPEDKYADVISECDKRLT